MSKRAQITADASIVSMAPYKDMVFTVTLDNGKAFTKHKRVAKKLVADIYFAHLYSLWERGINENTNGLLRCYLSRGADFMKLSEEEIKGEEEIQAVVYKLSHRPRRSRGYKIPHELFTGQSKILVAA